MRVLTVETVNAIAAPQEILAIGRRQLECVSLHALAASHLLHLHRQVQLQLRLVQLRLQKLDAMLATQSSVQETPLVPGAQGRSAAQTAQFVHQLHASGTSARIPKSQIALHRLLLHLNPLQRHLRQLRAKSETECFAHEQTTDAPGSNAAKMAPPVHLHQIHGKDAPRVRRPIARPLVLLLVPRQLLLLRALGIATVITSFHLAPLALTPIFKPPALTFQVVRSAVVLPPVVKQCTGISRTCIAIS